MKQTKILTVYLCRGLGDQFIILRMLSKGKEESIYSVSLMWTGPQGHQKADKEISIYRLFHLLNEERMIEFTYHFF